MRMWSTILAARTCAGSVGDRTNELNYVGKNHSDSTLVMRLPTEKVIW